MLAFVFRNRKQSLRSSGSAHLLVTETGTFSNPGELENWLDDINTNSRVVVSDAFAVPTLKEAALGDKFQFERLDSTPEKLEFNRTVTMKESSSKPG
ncbi:unnamed protein product [Arabidopsis thaliana]|uniref:tRNA synthetases class I (E and Q) anti-codon binding domain-containing protein n=1 Tax=Arabidopsis thaliana TaxID=3702 RepID=A0A654EM64_ARATH|nr:unnamed protein product [Arabidopsis thaliana]